MEDERRAMRAIRLKCLDCSGGAPQEVEECSVEQCPLYEFRQGKVPPKVRKKKEDRDESRKLNLPGL